MAEHTERRIAWRLVGVLAAKEWRDRLRNRWVLAVALLFALFALAIAYFGAAQQGAVGFRSLDATLASLASLVVYLVPLIALLLGYDAVVGERERGALDLLLSMPVSRFEVLLGKYLGLGAALTGATALGFGAGLLPLASQLTVSEGWRYAAFVAAAIAMGLAFLSVALLVSVLARDRVRASGAALALWFFFVLVYDLLLMGALVLSQGGMANSVFATLLMLNPADVFRLYAAGGTDAGGLAAVMPPGMTSGAALPAVMLTWMTLPFLIAYWRFKQ
ncbi:hypothetical protein ASD15_23650 [Massilia sp. Root351]|uniref:ABC transporter permease n=1 Tax=Massilia sp. Root351 TaxID=1736522 RepID=UPI00070C04FC|nr:ABC transporter permease subunit [Massilia sp. Root351]KQV90312.1 hypothetical protein ASD15_23650 [Massilia sp. Root351]